MHRMSARVATTLFSLVVASACSSSSPPQASPAPSDLDAALAGTPDDTTAAATEMLAPILDAADWFYLANATWPEDVSSALADPRLQKAMAPFLRAVVLSLPIHLDGYPAGAPPASHTYYDQAAAAMQAARGSRTAGTEWGKQSPLHFPRPVYRPTRQLTSRSSNSTRTVSRRR
jgi:hypothetical protein